MPKTQLPGFWRFAWMFFMQPVHLSNWLRACGITQPDTSAWRLWQMEGPQQSMQRGYIYRISGILLVSTLLTTFMLAILAGDSDLSFNLKMMASGVGMGVILAVTIGITIGAAFSVGFGIAFGIAFDITNAIISNAVLGITFSVAGNLPRRTTFRYSTDHRFIINVFVVIGLNIIFKTYDNPIDTLTDSLVLGVASGIVFLGAYWRLIPFYPFEALLQTALYMYQRSKSIVTLHYSPVLYHDLSYLPHPFLVRHALLTADSDPVLVRRVLEACAIVPGQRRSGKKILARLQARELDRLAQQGRFAELSQLKGQWLPGVTEAEPLLLGFQKVACHLLNASVAEQPADRRQALADADHALRTLARQRRAEKSILARALAPTLVQWQNRLRDSEHQMI